MNLTQVTAKITDDLVSVNHSASLNKLQQITFGHYELFLDIFIQSAIKRRTFFKLLN